VQIQASTVNYEPAEGYAAFDEHGTDAGLSQQTPLNSQSSFSQPIQQQDQSIPPQSQTRSHPVALFFHFLFKVSAVVIYLVKSFIGNFVISFIIIILLLAFDFWTVKNVSGRLLAGMRWWNEINADGTNRWVFESMEEQDRAGLDAKESTIFWISLFVVPAVWVLFLIASIFTFSPSSLIIVVVALALNAANVVGYMKCRKDAKQKVKSAATSFVFSQLFKSASG